jgi:hypothetical protein
MGAGDYATACAKLTDFINETRAQRDKKFITVSDADQLIAAAGQVKAVLGCP